MLLLHCHDVRKARSQLVQQVMFEFGFRQKFINFNSWADSLSAGREVPVGEFGMLTEKLSYLGTEWLKLYRLNA